MGSVKEVKEKILTVTKEEIGNKIKKFRKQAGFKRQEDLAKQIIVRKGQHTTKDQIGRIERGITNYGIDTLFQIANVLDVKISDFFMDENKEQQIIIFQGDIESLKKRLSNNRCPKCGNKT